jgi:putative CocE/NonD family hydrolase
LLWHKNFPKFSKVVMGPWLHDGTGHFDLAAEYIRWFDYWLKGIDNGIGKEPRVTYFTMGAPAGQQWRTSDVWLLFSQRLTNFYFDGHWASGDTNKEARSLTLKAPSEAGRVDYVIDYTTNMGNNNRWTSMVVPMSEEQNPLYPYLRENDTKGLTYTIEPLESATEVTGHPVAHLWLTSSVPDVDIFVYLVEMRADGSLHYVTEGQLRASHRGLADPPYDRMGLPYHRSYKEDVRPVAAGEVFELMFDLPPTSILFQKGSRIRVTITGADRDSFDTPITRPAPTFQVLHGGTHTSHIVLPIIGA